MPLDPARRPPAARDRVVLGIRPEAFEDGAFAPPGLPTLDVDVDVLEELGADAHVFFRVDARARSPRTCSSAEDEATLLARARRRSSPRASTRATSARVGDALRARGRPRALPLLRPGDAARASLRRIARRERPIAAAAARSGGRLVTKQSETRDRVLDLIERLGVGDAIPSERQLSADLGVSRLTVRAALDDLVREGYLVRRRGSGTFVSEPKIAQELTMTSFTEDMRRRGMAPASRTLELESSLPAPASGASSTSRRRSRRRREAPAPRRPRDDGDRDAARARGARAGADRPAISRSGSFYELLRDRYGIVIVGRRADDRADGDERGGVDGARRSAPLAGVPVRARQPRESGDSSSSCARSTAATATGWSPI